MIGCAGTDPLVWRRIQVPVKYSFWDLHVAIQDAMGWLDYHTTSAPRPAAWLLRHGRVANDVRT